MQRGGLGRATGLCASVCPSEHGDKSAASQGVVGLGHRRKALRILAGPTAHMPITAAAAAVQRVRMSGKAGAGGAASGQGLGGSNGAEERAPGDRDRPGGSGSQSHRTTLVSKCACRDRSGSTT